VRETNVTAENTQKINERLWPPLPLSIPHVEPIAVPDGSGDEIDPFPSPVSVVRDQQSPQSPDPKGTP